MKIKEGWKLLEEGKIGEFENAFNKRIKKVQKHQKLEDDGGYFEEDYEGPSEELEELINFYESIKNK